MIEGEAQLRDFGFATEEIAAKDFSLGLEQAKFLMKIRFLNLSLPAVGAFLGHRWAIGMILVRHRIVLGSINLLSFHTRGLIRVKRLT